MADAIQPLLARGGVTRPVAPDTAIFYSISNCQRGLSGISFGNFLIKQVVEDLKAELKSVQRFATLSPVPRFRAWLDRRLAEGSRNLLKPEERAEIVSAAGVKGAKGALKHLLAAPDWPQDPAKSAVLKAPLTRFAAQYLTASNGGKGPTDPVARFHLGNGARLERINFLANTGRRGLKESYGIMVNYLYDLERIEANHEAFVRHGQVARSDAVAELVPEERAAPRSAGGLLSFGRRGAGAQDGGSARGRNVNP
jgi:malonyl-CoA decarboxylase